MGVYNRYYIEVLNLHRDINHGSLHPKILFEIQLFETKSRTPCTCCGNKWQVWKSKHFEEYNKLIEEASAFGSYHWNPNEPVYVFDCKSPTCVSRNIQIHKHVSTFHFMQLGLNSVGDFLLDQNLISINVKLVIIWKLVQNENTPVVVLLYISVHEEQKKQEEKEKLHNEKGI